MSIKYFCRKTGEVKEEKVYGEAALRALYKDSWIATVLRKAVSSNSLVSSLYGFIQKRGWTKRKIAPFIEEYGVDPSEFLDPVSSFQSFNDFFIRKLKHEARPLANDAAVMPADARYLAYQTLDDTRPLIVKGQSFSLADFLQDPSLAEEFKGGSLLVARLCPSDYHRFHFPFDCTPGDAKQIPGPLFSVNPFAIEQNIRYLTENKRVITLLEDSRFGKVAYIEIGATNVGSIVETYTPDKRVKKGDEKGYFEFGGSSLVLLFRKKTILFSKDLTEATEKGIEIRSNFGEPLGSPL